jgi:sigma-54 dependent transcriptional regulator, acetoin dehydrogenase operon transcriptional activator AcoR
MAASHELATREPSASMSRVFGQSRGDFERAWEGFLTGAARETIGARSPILDSWERCRASHVSLATAYAPLISSETLDTRRRENRALLRASSETLADAADMLVGSETIMLVTDARGLVLEEVGDGAALRAGTDIALGKGGEWREGAVGTNGIGVALATAQPNIIASG